MQYQISRNGQMYGPYTPEDLQRYVSSGNVLPTDLARSDDTQDWLPVSQVLGALALNPTLLPPPPGGMQSVPGMINIAGLNAAYPPPPNLHWVALLVIGIFCGFFTFVWIFVQAAWMRKVDPASQAMSYYVGSVVALVVGMACTASEKLVIVAVLLFFASVGLIITGNLSLRTSIEKHFNTAEPIGLRLSVPMALFFNVYYFQYHFSRINEARLYGGLRRS